MKELRGKIKKKVNSLEEYLKKEDEVIRLKSKIDKNQEFELTSEEKMIFDNDFLAFNKALLKYDIPIVWIYNEDEDTIQILCK